MTEDRFIAFGKAHAWLVAAVVSFASFATGGCAHQTADATAPTQPAAETAAPEGRTPVESAADETHDPATDKAASDDGGADDATAPADKADPVPTDAAATSEIESTHNSASSSQDASQEQTRATPSDTKSAKAFSSSRAPARPGEAEKISFDDLIIGLQADVVYRPWMMKDRPKELDGKKVRIVGFMHGGIENPDKVPEFVLLRNLECKFGPGGQADHLAMVYMKPGEATTYPGKDSIKVEGILKVEPFVGVDGNTWSLYRIEDAVVVR